MTSSAEKIRLTRSGLTLAAELRRRGCTPDLVCGGRGVCGRCLVDVTQGEWLSCGRRITAPARLPACQTTLLSETGEAVAPSPGGGRVLTEFNALRPFPVAEEPVIGIDLGSTTVAAIRMERGIETHRLGTLNRQRSFGADVMSRIAAAGDPDTRRELQKLAADSINELLDAMPPAERIAVAGNTAMTLLLHGVDPTPLGSAPYTAPQLDFAPRRAEELGLHHAGCLYTFPCLSGWLGGDLSAALAEADPAPGEMIVDLGTNCEILFRPESEPEKLYGTSAAAGPAFEGAGISTGRIAGAGTVLHFTPGGEAVTGGEEAQGIAASALVELLAFWRRTGVLDRDGHFTASGEKARAYAPHLTLTEADAAAFLQAKAAVATAITALSHHLGSPVRALKVAGGMAAALDFSAARQIGLLPDLPVTAVGNTSLAGALRLALQPENGEFLAARRRDFTEIRLAELQEFPLLYADHLVF